MTSYPQIRRVLLHRVRLAMYLTLVLNLGYLAADLGQGVWHSIVPIAHRVILIATMIGGLAWLQRRPSRRAARRLGELTMVLLILLPLRVGLEHGDFDRLRVLCVAVSIGGGVFLHLGVWPQIRIAFVAVASLLAPPLLLGSGQLGSSTLTALLGIGGGLVATFEANRGRRLIDSSLSSAQLEEERLAQLAASAPVVSCQSSRDDE